MATIDIGKLTFTHKGDYAGGTAYVANDVVYYNGSAYIAKTSTTGNLPTSTAHWNVFSAGSGGIWNSGLSIGTAGQVVKVNSGASALEFGTVESELVQLKKTSVTSTTATVDFDFTGVDDSVYTKYIFSVYAKFDTGANTRVRLRQAGSTITSSHYNYGLDYSYRNLSANSNHTSNGHSENDNHWRFQDWAATQNDYETATFELVKPQSTNNTKYIMGHGCIPIHNGGTYAPSAHSFCSYYHGNQSAWTGFHFYPSSGNFVDFEIIMHGLKK